MKTRRKPTIYFYTNGVSHITIKRPQRAKSKWKRTTRAVLPQREES